MRFRSRRAGCRAALLAIGLSLAGCQQKEEAQQTPAAAKSLEQIKTELEDLASRFGEDAYTQPEVDEFIRQLDATTKDAPNWKASIELADWLRAKRRIAWQVTDAPPPPPINPNAAQYGPLQIQGAAPKTPEARAEAAKIAEGATREELVKHYGSCLVRQTWFPGESGGPTTELFHVKPECRGELEPRIFMVAGEKVAKVSPGNLDKVMDDPESATRNEER